MPKSVVAIKVTHDYRPKSHYRRGDGGCTYTLTRVVEVYPSYCDFLSSSILRSVDGSPASQISILERSLALFFSESIRYLELSVDIELHTKFNIDGGFTIRYRYDRLYNPISNLRYGLLLWNRSILKSPSPKSMLFRI